MVRLSILRLAIAAVLAGCGLLCGCSNIASARIGFTASPLGLSIDLTGPTAIGSVPTYTLPAGGTLSYITSDRREVPAATAPAAGPLNVVSGNAATLPASQ